MEREIKFEVRRDDTKEIIGHERIGERGQWEHKRINRDEWLLGAITDGQEYSKFIRNQFTGLTDKNKVETFFNISIVKFKLLTSINEYIELIGVPFYDETELRFQLNIYGNSEYIALNYFYNGQMFDFEVVGNIHDNPELLK